MQVLMSISHCVGLTLKSKETNIAIDFSCMGTRWLSSMNKKVVRQFDKIHLFEHHLHNDKFMYSKCNEQSFQRDLEGTANMYIILGHYLQSPVGKPFFLPNSRLRPLLFLSFQNLIACLLDLMAEREPNYSRLRSLSYHYYSIPF